MTDEPLPALEKAIEALRGVIAIRVDPVVLSLNEARALLAEIDRRSAGSVREALIKLNAAIDAMWNDPRRREPVNRKNHELAILGAQLASYRALRGPGGGG